MILSNTTKIPTDFILGSGKKPRINPLPYNHPPVKTLVISPNQLFTQGLAIEFEHDDTVDIIRASTSVYNALEYWSQQPSEVFPDLLLIDTQQRRIACREAILRFKCLHNPMKILVMGDHFRDERIKDYFDVGADGYVDQAASAATFRQAIDFVVHHHKKFLFTPQLPFHGYVVMEEYE